MLRGQPNGLCSSSNGHKSSDPDGLLQNRETGKRRKWLGRVLGRVLGNFGVLAGVLARGLHLIPFQGTPPPGSTLTSTPASTLNFPGTLPSTLPVSLFCSRPPGPQYESLVRIQFSLRGHAIVTRVRFLCGLVETLSHQALFLFFVLPCWFPASSVFSFVYFQSLLCSHWRLGEGKWGRKKCRRIPKCEGDWQGRVPKCSLTRKTFQNKGFGAPNF